MDTDCFCMMFVGMVPWAVVMGSLCSKTLRLEAYIVFKFPVLLVSKNHSECSLVNCVLESRTQKSLYKYF